MIESFYAWYSSITNACRNVDLRRYDKRPSLVAHSFGTWIVCYAMQKYEEIRFDKLILCGCILPRDFDWNSLFARDQVALVRNECGQMDPWPRIARRFVARAGSAGSDGFDWFGSLVQNDYCAECKHSDSLLRSHMEHVWLPFLFLPPNPLSVLHGRDIHDGVEFSKNLKHTGTRIDVEAFGQLPNYNKVVLPRGLSTSWIEINADIYTFLIDRRSRVPAGYLNAMPVVEGAYSELRSGAKTDNQVTAQDIVPYVGNQSVKMYLMSVAIAKDCRRWGEGLFQQGYVKLINAFIDKMTYYARNHGIRVTHFLAIAWTAEGLKLCESFGMRKVGVDGFGDDVFELDVCGMKSANGTRVLPGVRRLIKLYQDM